ncbi:hypothetical protein [Streptomyces sp. NPDC047718]|uniref:hypothetical protein n=1 Tax=Streptomyces sp. NPDC047718 TaxID=3155479 RepID=UPI0033C4DA67
MAEALRYLQRAAGLTFKAMAVRPEVTVSAATLKRAASGDTVPKAKTVKEFAAACRADTPMTEFLLWQRIRARIEERGILRRLRAPKVELIADRADLSLALAYAYEAAGAPTLREIQENSDNPHALPLSTLGRVVARNTVPADEQQLLAFLHGCGVRDQDPAWRKAWAKVASAHEGLVEGQQSRDRLRLPPGAPAPVEVSTEAWEKQELARATVDLSWVTVGGLSTRDGRGDRGAAVSAPSTYSSRAASIRSQLDRNTFYRLVAERGATVLGEGWRGVNGVVTVKCFAGHMSAVRPMEFLLQLDHPLCSTCGSPRRNSAEPGPAQRHLDTRAPAPRQQDPASSRRFQPR